jgi:formylglycine-generating enzyme required for sulfatase activity
VKVVLDMECFGKPASLEGLESCDPRTGAIAAQLSFEAGGPDELPEPGSWGDESERCEGDVPAGMACVDGGVLLLGSRAYAPFGPDFDPVPEQLVRVSPFFLDLDELTVADLRPLVARGLAEPAQTSATEPYCTYTSEPGESEQASVNCITRALAAAACEMLDKRLPTEAEWEFAAGNRGDESPFPWPTEDADTSVALLCSKSIVARGELGDETASRQCILESGYPVGPQIGGSASDVGPLGIKNLGGNLSEWVSDDFARYEDATCWGPDIALLRDPRCVSDASLGVLRGGSWLSITYNAHVHFRRSAPSSIEADSVGLRCARDAR